MRLSEKKMHIWTMHGHGEYNNYRIAVPSGFGELFSHFYFAENTSGEAITRTILPSFQTIMVFSFGAPVSFLTNQNDEITIDKCIVIGPIKQAFSYTLSAGAEILVANFRDDAFFRFFGTSSIARYVNPDDLLEENCFTALWRELSLIKDVNEKVTHVLDFSKPYINPRNPLTEKIVAVGNSNVSPVKEISEAEKLSERAVQMNLKKHLGYSSREISRYLRFLSAIEMIQQAACGSGKMDWFEVIEVCGYYDQSQLIHDFKHYLNISPSKYLKFQQSICSSRG